MVKPHEKLARSLSVLLERQGERRRVFRSAEFRREDRERLVRSGYLLPITRVADALQSRLGEPRHDSVVRIVLGVLHPVLHAPLR